MPADGSQVANGVTSRRTTSGLASQLSTLDPSRVLIWDTPDALGQFHHLVENPPIHSLVVHIEPAMAEQLLLVTNNRNRPMHGGNVSEIVAEIEEGVFELTGDTIKFSKSGILLDGQHRLQSCVRSKKPITTHVIFGLDDAIFDILDRARKRSPGDILALCGVENYNLIAATIRWVLRLEGSVTWPAKVYLTPRKTRELALGRLKDVKDYAVHGQLISAAFKHPPSMIAGISYMIGRKSKALAEGFIHDWAHGPRTGRNQNFDVLSKRFIQIAHQSGGHINSSVRAALIIQAFNHWNAEQVASARSLTWRKGWKFPTLEFNKAAFLKKAEHEAASNTALTATQMRVFKALSKSADEYNKAQMSLADIADKSNTPKGSVHYILSTLIDEGMIKMVKPADGNQPAVYRLKVDDPAEVNA